MRGICAVSMILLAMVGCTLPDAFRLSIWEAESAKGPNGSSKEVYFEGSLDGVVQTTQAVLNRLGISAEAAEQKDKFILHCTTRQGNRFDLFLWQGVKEGSPKTWIDFAWEGPADTKLRGEIIAGVMAAKLAR
jgi:hypothetical protein